MNKIRGGGFSGYYLVLVPSSFWGIAVSRTRLRVPDVEMGTKTGLGKHKLVNKMGWI